MRIAELARDLRTRLAGSVNKCRDDVSVELGGLTYIHDAHLIRACCRCTCGELHVRGPQILDLVAASTTATDFLHRLDRHDAAAHG